MPTAILLPSPPKPASPVQQLPRPRSSHSSADLPSFSPVVAAIPDLRALRLSRSRKDRPCDACRKRKTRCFFSDASQICAFCRTHGKHCTFINKPLPRRKRSDATAVPLRRNSSSEQSSSSSSMASNGDGAPSAGSQAVAAAAAVNPVVVRSVESDDGLPSPVPQEPAAVMRKIAAADFAAVVESYFAAIWPAYPVVAKADVVGSLHADSAGSGQILLAAICLIASNTSEPTLDKFSEEDWLEMIQYVKTGLDAAVRRPDVRITKAALLLSNSPDLDLKAAACRLLEANRDATSALKGDRYPSRTDDPVSWAASSAEWAHGVWSALFNGAPLDPTSPIGADRPFEPHFVAVKQEDGEPSSDIFLQYIQLTQIVAQLCNAFGAQDSRREPLRQTLQRVKPVQLGLKNWFSSLPPHYTTDNEDPLVASASASLHLAYYAAEIALHRHIVLAVGEADMEKLADICRPAARTRLISAMDFINRLRLRHLQGYWFCSASECFSLVAEFGELLLETSTNGMEAAFYTDRLAELRWTLGVDSKYAPFLTEALQVLRR